MSVCLVVGTWACPCPGIRGTPVDALNDAFVLAMTEKLEIA